MTFFTQRCVVSYLWLIQASHQTFFSSGATAVAAFVAAPQPRRHDRHVLLGGGRGHSAAAGAGSWTHPMGRLLLSRNDNNNNSNSNDESLVESKPTETNNELPSCNIYVVAIPNPKNMIQAEADAKKQQGNNEKSEKTKREFRELVDGNVKSFLARMCVGLRDDIRNNILYLTLGGCNEKRLVDDPVGAAKAEDKAMVFFQSKDPCTKLVDFAYKDDSDNYHAFQLTSGEKRHPANVDLIMKLQDVVGGPSKLSFYYVVSQENFASFNTTPVDPKKNTDVTCKVYVVAIET
jgi:hypothetical protein